MREPTGAELANSRPAAVRGVVEKTRERELRGPAGGEAAIAREVRHVFQLRERLRVERRVRERRGGALVAIILDF